MITEKLLTINQPLTHTSQSTFLEKICCKDYSLNTQQLNCFYPLKTQSNILFEGENQKFDKIKYLYKLYFQKDCPINITTKDWLKLGFQGDRPERDLRGGGVLALQLIIKFVQKEKNLVKKMGEQSSDFFFAISAVNVAFFMKKYFHLADFLEVQLDRKEYCGRKQLKNFCRILVSDLNAYSNMHLLFLKYFFNQIWLQMKRTNKNTSLLNFNDAFQLLKNKISHTLNIRLYSTWIQFQKEFIKN